MNRRILFTLLLAGSFMDALGIRSVFWVVAGVLLAATIVASGLIGRDRVQAAQA